uniref:Uncharacterized protein n=1 Tax=Arundo donax TaxID=35708 RepID=A0A0A8ZNH5_ARUDO
MGSWASYVYTRIRAELGQNHRVCHGPPGIPCGSAPVYNLSLLELRT